MAYYTNLVFLAINAHLYLEMKRTSIFFTIGLLSIGLLAISCKGKKSSGAAVSSKTGMKYNDKYNGGFEVNKKVKEGPGAGLVAIEGGTFVMGGSLNQDLSYEYDNVRRRVTVASFYIDETEVANVDWLEYLYWIQTKFPEDREYYYNALPDTLVWRQPLSYNEPYVNNYLRHPAFQDYPVVGVTWEQANAYCEWRTDRVNEEILRSKGYLADYKTLAEGGKSKGKGKAGAATTAAAGTPTEPFNTDIYLNGQYRGEGIDGKKMKKDLSPSTAAALASAPKGKGKSGGPVRTIRIEDGVLKQAYRLPTEAEWEYAALALAGNTKYENISDGKIYAWNGLGVRSADKKTQGMMLANFKRGEGDNMGIGGYLNDKADVTAPVRSYIPNDFGLYNMSGNVNEWVADVYRKLSFEDFEDFNPFRGNVYVNKSLADKSKGIYAKDKYGRPIQEPTKSGKKQKWAEVQNDQTTKKDSLAKLEKAYNPDFRGHLDTVNQNLYGVTTLVNDKSRVYKGGSWNDRAYWLNPATRRFMAQDEASAEVGFRCAMTMVGAPEINSKGKPEFTAQPSRAKK